MDVRADEVVVSLHSQPLRQRQDDTAQVLKAVSRQFVEGERAWLGEAYAICVYIPVRLIFRGGRSWLVKPSGLATHDRPVPTAR